MSKLAIGEVPAPLGKREFGLQLRDPAIVRHLAFRRSEKLIMHAGAPAFEDQLAMFVESDPNGTFRDHHFALMRPGQTISVDGIEADYCGTAFDASGTPAHLYEVRKATS